MFKKINTTHKHRVSLVKWYPIVTTFFVTVCLLALISGYTKIDAILSPLFGCAALMSIKELLFSISYKLCFWHQLLLINLFILAIIVLIDVISPFKDQVFKVWTLFAINIVSIVVSFIFYKLTSKS